MAAKLSSKILCRVKSTWQVLQGHAPHNRDWSYQEPGSCLQVGICRDCGNTVERVFHDWGEWVSDEEGHNRACRRCPETESAPHSWQRQWNCWDYDHDWFELVCTICGKVGDVVD